MPGDETITVKGTPVRSLQRFIEHQLTPAQREAVFQALPAEYSTRLRGPILATETIPIHVLNVMCDAAARARGEPPEEFARRAGREAAGDAMKGIYRFFAFVLTPAALLGRAAQMWSALNNRGEMQVEGQGDGAATISLLDYPAEPALCGRVSGWIERMAEMTGAKNVHVEQTQCYAKGAPHCQWNVTWS